MLRTCFRSQCTPAYTMTLPNCQAVAGPSSNVALTRIANTAGNALKDDRRGYPHRAYRTRVLRIDPANVQFSGKGKEPFRDVLVEVKSKTEEDSLQQASQILQQSHLVAFPTETVYGLAGNALDPEAVQKIFHAKGRPADNPLIVHISDLSMLERLVPSTYSPTAAYRALIDAFWPGPLTLLMPVDEDRVPSVVRCGLQTLGVRMPSHAVARALIARANLPLAAPSANVSGKPSPTTAQHVFHDMTSRIHGSSDTCVGRIPLIIDGGACQVGVESTVVDGITNPTELRVLRPGGVGVEAIKSALEAKGLLLNDRSTPSATSSAVRVCVYGKDVARDAEAESTPTTPGMKYRHYSPEADVVLLISDDEGQSTAQHMAAQALGRDTAKKMLARPPKEIIDERVAALAAETGKQHIHVGLMCLDDSHVATTMLTGAVRSHSSPFYSTVECTVAGSTAYTLHGFSLGSVRTPEQAAHRLFNGLRSLDGGERDCVEGEGALEHKCDVIFVEASTCDEGVGLAILNRLNKAASQTFFVIQQQ